MLAGPNETMKKETMLAVYRAVADASCSTRAEIAGETGLSTVTVGKAAEALVDSGLLHFKVSKKRGVGRRAEMLAVDRGDAIMVMDVSAYGMFVTVFNMFYEVIGTRDLWNIPDCNYHDDLMLLVRKAYNFVATLPCKCRFACLVVPGHYDRASDRVIGAHGGFNELKLRDFLYRTTNKNIELVIDGDIAALRYCQHYCRPHKNILLFFVFRDIKARLVLNGRDCAGGSTTCEIVDEMNVADQIAKMAAFAISTVKLDAIFIQTCRCPQDIRSERMTLMIEDKLMQLDAVIPPVVINNDVDFTANGAVLISRTSYLTRSMRQFISHRGKKIAPES